jgi:uncharacterized protein YecT (DUF1311 family)
MRKIFIGLLCVAAAISLGAAAQTAPAVKGAAALDCASATTQARMNECAHEDFLAATAAYAASYKAISNKLGAKQKDQFRRTQTLWIQYRTAACNFESSGVAGGSAQAMVKSQCDARMTRARTAELEKLASCREGDVSCLRFGK